MDTLKMIKGYIDKVLIFFCILFCGLMVAFVFWQVFSRFVLNDPSAISESAARYLFVWMSLTAAALLYGGREHMNIAYFLNKMDPVKKNILLIISELFTLVIASWILTYCGFNMAMKNMMQVESSMTWLKIGQIYAIIPIVGVCIIYYSIYNILDSIMQIRNCKSGTGAQEAAK
ncbi:MAG: TRAP transporter small permease [Succinivibrionaceae bacterium]|nr:TRAP transporter small permease [Succinivibrionaceae bacterium]